MNKSKLVSSTIDTDAFYRDSVAAGFVKEEAIARNIEWVSPTKWGDIQVTINLSKPEKDPEAIAKAAKDPEAAARLSGLADAPQASASAPGKPVSKRLCALCVNQDDLDSGYARAIQINGEPWGLWYSPYAYFNEHCIAMSWEHRPMHIDAANFEGLFDFVDQFPQYFIGSNTDLPIVGGSILVHDHYQGGRHVFPLQEAPLDRCFSLPGFPQVKMGVVRWPLTVVRMEAPVGCAGRSQLVAAACTILGAWQRYSNDELGIVAFTSEDGSLRRHNTVTPMLRIDGDTYVFDLALRCNITSHEHPFGVFHPHEHLHDIKKENIGLIEVMGRAILPPRIMRAMDVDDPAVRDQIGRRFGEVLECCGVFKWDAAGQSALDAFLAS